MGNFLNTLTNFSCSSFPSLVKLKYHCAEFRVADSLLMRTRAARYRIANIPRFLTYLCNSRWVSQPKGKEVIMRKVTSAVAGALVQGHGKVVT